MMTAIKWLLVECVRLLFVGGCLYGFYALMLRDAGMTHPLFEAMARNMSEWDWQEWLLAAVVVYALVGGLGPGIVAASRRGGKNDRIRVPLAL